MGGFEYRLNNGTIERRQNGVIVSSSALGAIEAFLLMDSEDRLNLWFKTASFTGVFGEVDSSTLQQYNSFSIEQYDGLLNDPVILLGQQPLQTIADPIEGEPIPGMVGSMRFSSSFNSGTIQYTIDQTNWITIDNASNLERSYMAVDGVMFNKSQDGMTFTKVIPGQWLLLPTDAGMFANVANNPGSVLLGIYEPPTTPPTITTAWTMKPFGEFRINSGITEGRQNGVTTVLMQSNQNLRDEAFILNSGFNNGGWGLWFKTVANDYGVISPINGDLQSYDWSDSVVTESEYLAAKADPTATILSA